MVVIAVFGVGSDGAAWFSVSEVEDDFYYGDDEDEAGEDQQKEGIPLRELLVEGEIADLL